MTPNKLKLFGLIFLFSISVNFNIFAQLKDSSNQADYIIITPSLFVNTLQPFAEWRQLQNLNVKVVELQQIYSEFPDSSEPYSIRDFISYTLTYWSDPKPKYILLVGNSEFLPDYKVPSMFADTTHYEDSVAIDEWYSVNSYQSDTEPDVELGRFPVNNGQELNNIIDKTIYFEDSLSFKNYNTDFLFLADKTQAALFEDQANQFINNTVPYNFSIDTVFAGQDSIVERTREKLFDAINSGTLFLSYYGHGAPYTWSGYNIFTVGDVDSLQKNNLPFIFTAAACDQSFDYPNDSSIVRKLLVLDKSGTVASINSTGLNYLSLGSNFLNSFYNYLFKNQNASLGEAALQAKLSLENQSTSEDAIPRRYTLLGDPALKIPFGTIAQVDNSAQNIPENYSLKQNFPNPFNPTTTIRYSIPKAVHITIKVYNIIGQLVATLIDEYKQAGNYEIKFNGSNLSSGVYFYRMQAGNFVEAKKLLLVK